MKWQLALCCLTAAMLTGVATPARAADPELVLQLGHTERVTALQYSPDGKWLASGDDHCVRLWDAATGRLVRKLQGGASDIAFLPDGRMAALGLGVARFWDCRTWQCRLVTYRGTGWRAVSTISRDGSQLAAGQPHSGDDDTLSIGLIATRTGAQVRSLKWKPLARTNNDYRDNKVNVLAYTPDGRQLLSGHEDGTMRVWDAHTGALRKIITISRYGLGALAVSPDGATVVAGCTMSSLPRQLWDLASGKAIVTLGGLNYEERRFAFSADGTYLAAPHGIWDAKTGAELQRWDAGDAAVALSPDGTKVAHSHYYGFEISAVGAAAADPVIRANRMVRAALAFSPDSRSLAHDRHLWDLTTGRLVLSREVVGYVDDVVFSPDGNAVMAELSWREGDDYRSELWRWSKVDGRLLSNRTLQSQVWLAAGGRFLALNGYTRVSINDLQTGKTVGPFKCGDHSRSVFAFSSDGKAFVTVTDTKTGPILRDSATGGVIKAIQVRKDDYQGNDYSLTAVSPRRKYIVTQGSTTPLMVWDVPTGKPLVELGRSECHGLTFAPDDNTLGVSGPITRVWDVPTARIKYSLPHIAYNLRFSPDGRLVIGTDFEGAVQVCDARDGRLLVTFQLLTGEPQRSAMAEGGASAASGSMAENSVEWIAYTPAGYYEASPGAAEFIAWRRGDTVSPASSEELTYHRPDLVAAALQGKTP